MKKGMAVEGYIQENGTVKPLEKYDDTELQGKIQENKDKLDNHEARISELESSGGGGGSATKIGDNDTYVHTDTVEHRVEIYADEFELNIGNEDGVAIVPGNVGNLYRAVLAPDTVPTENSDKLIVSGGVYAALSKKMDKPVVPALVKDYLAMFDGNGNVKSAGVKVAGLAPKNHSHEVGDIIGLNLHTKDVCLYEDGQHMIINQAGGDEQAIEEIIGRLKSIIGGAVSGINGDVSNTMFYANIYRDSQSFGEEVPDSQGLIHVWSKRTDTALYDFCIEVYYGDSIYYTTVSDVRVSGGSVDYEDATFEEVWHYGEIGVKPKTITIEDSQGDLEALNSTGQVTQLYKACMIGRAYPVLTTVNYYGGSTPDAEVYGTLIVKMTTGSTEASMTIYFGGYKVVLTADGVTRSAITGGTVEDEDVTWSGTLVNYNTIF